MRTLIFIIAAFQVYGKDVIIPEGSFSYPGSCYPVNCWRHYVGKYLVPLPDGQTECSDTVDVHDVKVQGYEHDWKNVCQATVRYITVQKRRDFFSILTFQNKTFCMHCLILNPESRFIHYYQRIADGEDVLGNWDNQTKRAICHYKPPEKCHKERDLRSGTCECFTAYDHSETLYFKDYGTPEFDRQKLVTGNGKKAKPYWNNNRWY